MRVVYQNPVRHPETAVVNSQVLAWEDGGEIISDGAAQAIASWWHSPGSPNSTRLSTMGIVTDDMCIEDFADAAEYLLADFDDAVALDALEAYILYRQKDHF
jgi:hypothetical protein